MPLRLLDVARPARMLVERVDGQADDLDAALVKFRLDPGHVSELGGADRREVLGMREQHNPGVADPIVKADLAVGRLSFEIRRGIVDLQRHRSPPESSMRGGDALASRRPGPFADVDVRTHAHGRRGSGAKLNTVRKGSLNWHTDSNGPACLP